MATIPVTTSHTITPEESGSLFSNEGATNQVPLVLPPCAPDLVYEMLIVAPHYFRVRVDDTEKEEILFERGGSPQAAASLKHNGVGSCLRLVGTGSFKWLVTNPIAANTWDE